MVVSLKKLNQIIDTRSERVKVMAYNPESDLWIAVDNSSGNAWTEEFSIKTKAIEYLYPAAKTVAIRLAQGYTLSVIPYLEIPVREYLRELNKNSRLVLSQMKNP